MLGLFFFIILGLILLVIGADLLVKGASNIAYKFNIPEVLVGLTIVAFRYITTRINYNNYIRWKK